MKLPLFSCGPEKKKKMQGGKIILKHILDIRPKIQDQITANNKCS